MPCNSITDIDRQTDGWLDCARKTQRINRQRVRQTNTFQYLFPLAKRIRNTIFCRICVCVYHHNRQPIPEISSCSYSSQFFRQPLSCEKAFHRNIKKARDILIVFNFFVVNFRQILIIF